MRTPELKELDCRLVTDVALAGVEVAIFFAEPQIAIPVGLGVIVARQVIENPPNTQVIIDHFCDKRYASALGDSAGYLRDTTIGCWKAGIPGALGRLLTSSRALIEQSVSDPLDSCVET